MITFRKRVTTAVKILLLLCFTGFFFGNTLLNAQVSDSVITKPHSPKTASIMSAVLPGLGQAYNKKYWKIPIIYTGAAAVTYFAVTNNKYYSKYKTAFKLRTDNDPATIDDYDGKYTTQNLLDLKNYYRRNLELTVIVGVAIYALNIIDASVDAHLYNFDIDDNLSLRASPMLLLSQNKVSPGISLSLNLKSFR